MHILFDLEILLLGIYPIYTKTQGKIMSQDYSLNHLFVKAED